MSAHFLIIIILTFSCSVVHAQKGKNAPTLQEVNKEVDTRSIRTRTNEVFTRMTGQVEELADGIHRSSNEQLVQNRALIWKVSAVGAAQHAFFDNDPIIALLDAYAFSLQQEYFFKTGNGRGIFGVQQESVDRFATELREELLGTIEGICGEHGYECLVLQNIDNWSKENPIESLYFSRLSVIEGMADLVGPFRKGIGKRVADLSESIQDMSSRMNIYSQILPKQMRWEMQLVIAQLQMQQVLDSSMLAMNEFRALGQDMPLLMDSMMAAGMLEAHAMSRYMIGSMSNERIEMQDWAKAMTDSLSVMMLTESESWAGLVAEQRELAFSDANEMMLASTDPIKSVIDHAFWKGVQLIILLIVLITAAFIIVKKFK